MVRTHQGRSGDNQTQAGQGPAGARCQFGGQFGGAGFWLGRLELSTDRSGFPGRQHQNQRAAHKQPAGGLVQGEPMTEVPAEFEVKPADFRLQRLVFWLRGELVLERQQAGRFPRVIGRGGEMAANDDGANQQAEDARNPCGEDK
jgi:hypothetical protein